MRLYVFMSLCLWWVLGWPASWRLSEWPSSTPFWKLCSWAGYGSDIGHLYHVTCIKDASVFVLTHNTLSRTHCLFDRDTTTFKIWTEAPRQHFLRYIYINAEQSYAHSPWLCFTWSYVYKTFLLYMRHKIQDNIQTSRHSIDNPRCASSPHDLTQEYMLFALKREAATWFWLQ